MKKIYESPKVEVMHINTSKMIAASLQVFETEITKDDMLSREDFDFSDDSFNFSDDEFDF